ncbi:Protoporphyrinogen oxidase [Handroanthus impetiginosus]|uniref:Protoporphyrinogen oxidase n=1 Tax=Handroanthus impetiginosus TaxID=429701 RepID=A0A2G9HU74_9LAMI|nr:Protoporphyrinogen oxidase [Handroanthus impetiginosus]
MAGVASKVAVIGSGISGAVCASILAKNGVSVTIFETARGPGGRMSQRREHSEDGRELLFDHGAPYFTVNASNFEVRSLVTEWESRGLVAEWKEKFGSFDFSSKKFINVEEEGSNKRYVGVPGMNSICRALCNEPGVESRFGIGIGRLHWSEDDDIWSLTSLDGEGVGQFKGVVASDKNTFSSRFTSVTGKPPPIDLISVSDMALQINEIPASPCFALMLAFEQPLSSIPKKGFNFKNSEILSWAYCDSSKPGRLTISERWVLHSTADYANLIISQTGFQKPSNAVLTKVAEELFQEFQNTGLDIPQPFFKKAHRWGSAFPAASVASEEKCLWFGTKRLAICGDFCTRPNVEGAICSGIAAAANFVKVLSTL